MHQRDHGKVLHCTVATCVDMPFIRCTEEETYAPFSALIVRNCSEITDAALIAHSLDYVEVSHPYDSPHLLTRFE